jgi:hypothetical protein
LIVLFPRKFCISIRFSFPCDRRAQQGAHAPLVPESCCYTVLCAKMRGGWWWRWRWWAREERSLAPPERREEVRISSSECGRSPRRKKRYRRLVRLQLVHGSPSVCLSVCLAAPVPSTLSLPITLTFIQQHTIIYHHHHKQCAIYFQLQSDPRDSQHTSKSDRHQLRLGHQ